MSRTNLLLISVVTALTSVTASASILTPGETGVAPDVFSSIPGTLVTDQTLALDSATYDASVTEAVYSGTNALCPTTSCVTFVYQVTDTSAVSPYSGIIEDLTASPFAGYSTDVGYVDLTSSTSLFKSGGLNPCTVGRAAADSGTVISFDYPNSGGGACDLDPGDSTSVLIIETNAPTYTTGLFSAIDGATATVAGYAPSGAVIPEPASLMLMGSALLALGMARRRMKRQ